MHHVRIDSIQFGIDTIKSGIKLLLHSLKLLLQLSNRSQNLGVGIALLSLRGRSRATPISFGPFIAASGWVMLMFDPATTLKLIDPTLK